MLPRYWGMPEYVMVDYTRNIETLFLFDLVEVQIESDSEDNAEQPYGQFLEPMRFRSSSRHKQL